MKMIVVYASQHLATREIAERLAGELRAETGAPALRGRSRRTVPIDPSELELMLHFARGQKGNASISV